MGSPVRLEFVPGRLPWPGRAMNGSYYPRRRARVPLTDCGLLGLAVLLTYAAGLALAQVVLP